MKIREGFFAADEKITKLKFVVLEKEYPDKMNISFGR